MLGAKQYLGNVQRAHQPLPGIEPKHFSHWLYLFLDTVESRYEPAAAVRFMEPALRIAQSLQLSRFGWDYRFRRSSRRCWNVSRHGARGVTRMRILHVRKSGEPFPTRIIGGDGNDE